MPRAHFSYCRRRADDGTPRLVRTPFARVAAWASRYPPAAAARHLSLRRVSDMVPTVRAVIAVQAAFRRLQGLRTLHMSLSRVPAEFLAVLPRGLRVLHVHRVSGFLALTKHNLGRLRELERVSICARHGITVYDMTDMPRLRDVRLVSDVEINWDGGGCDRLDVLALHAPRVCLRTMLCPVACMSVSAVHLLFGSSNSARHTEHTGILSPPWSSGLRRLRILVDHMLELEDLPYNDMVNLHTLELSCNNCPVTIIPLGLTLLPRLRHVAIATEALLVFEDRLLTRGDDGYPHLPSRATWAVTKPVAWASRRRCADLDFLQIIRDTHNNS